MSGEVFTLNEVGGKWRWICGRCDGHSRSYPAAQQAQDDFYARHIPCPQDQFALTLCEDNGTLIVGIRADGSIATGPNYQPDVAAREFWDAVTRAAQAANPWEAT